MNLNYAIASVIIFVLEVFIAFSSGFIRHTLGDYFVVILLYCLIKSVSNFSYKNVCISVLVIAFIIEYLQLLNLESLYPERFKHFFKILFGTSFSYGDLVAYKLGIVTVFFIEHKRYKQITKIDA